MPISTLIAKDLAFTYAEEHHLALYAERFYAAPGELIFVTGVSGCGKSTLLNIINGTIPEVIEGELSGTLERFDTQGHSVIDIWQAVGNVFQNPRSQFFSTNSTAELVFGMENFGYPKATIQKRLDEIVTLHRAQNLLDRNIFDLSSGERQRLALLSVLMIDPPVLLFDEPSANLDYHHACWLKRELARLKAQGKTIIVADHRSFYLEGLIDTYWHIDGGNLEVYRSFEDCIAAGHQIRPANLWHIPLAPRTNISPGAAKITVQDLSYKTILQSVSLTCNEGEITFLVGANGAGKTTLARLISGALKPDKGEITTIDTPLYLMQDADYQLFGASCAHELSLGIAHPHTPQTAQHITETLATVGLSELSKHHPQQLSGGQKQRLQLAIALMSERKVWLMDEPTSGLDQKSMNCLVDQLNEARKTRTILVISHDYEFIVNAADRIVYLKNGVVAEDFRLSEQTLSQLQRIFQEMEETI